jgi:hypothetical protein
LIFCSPHHNNYCCFLYDNHFVNKQPIFSAPAFASERIQLHDLDILLSLNSEETSVYYYDV